MFMADRPRDRGADDRETFLARVPAILSECLVGNAVPHRKLGETLEVSLYNHNT